MDLFGEISVTQADIELWLDSIKQTVSNSIAESCIC